MIEFLLSIIVMILAFVVIVLTRISERVISLDDKMVYLSSDGEYTLITNNGSNPFNPSKMLKKQAD